MQNEQRRAESATVPESQPDFAHALPHSLEAEQAVLGAILANNEIYERVGELLDIHHFFEPLHSRIYGKCAEFIRAGRLAAPATLHSALANDAALIELGGLRYLNNLAVAGLSVISPRDYAQLVHDLALRRELIAISDQMREIAFDGGHDLAPDDQIENAESRLFELAERGRSERGFEPFRMAATKVVNIAESAFKKTGHVAGISTGFRDLDLKLGGLFPSDLIIVAARPGMGKTSLATNIAFNIARAYRSDRGEDGLEHTVDGGAVGFFSLEMSSEQLALRIMAEQAEIPSQRIRKGQISEDEYRRLVAVCSDLERMPFHIDQTGAIPISILSARARRLKRRTGLDLIVVDYLQLMAPSGRKRHDNRVQEVTEITQGLKALAKELNVPIIACAQLSRAVEQRENKRPVLADLRESGSIEQDADVVMFIYREEYYLESQQPPPDSPEFLAWQEKAEPAHGIAEILIEKHRHGPTGAVSLQFMRDFTRFGNLERANYPPPAYQPQ